VYCYVYDEFVQDKRFEKELQLIENRLTDLGIAGKVIRLALFRHAEEMIRDEVERGVSTVVAVGNDETVRKVIDVVADSGVVFGIIPLGSPNGVAQLIGVPEGLAACDVLSGRIVETIDVGTINGSRFITGISVPKFRAEITCEGKYRMFTTSAGALEILNLSNNDVRAGEGGADPRDGQLDTVIRVGVKKGFWPFRRTRVGQSYLSMNSLAIRSESPIAVYADGVEMTGTRFDIGIEPGRFKVITGKDRKF